MRQFPWQTRNLQHCLPDVPSRASRDSWNMNLHQAQISLASIKYDKSAHLTNLTFTCRGQIQTILIDVSGMNRLSLFCFRLRFSRILTRRHNAHPDCSCRVLIVSRLAVSDVKAAEVDPQLFQMVEKRKNWCPFGWKVRLIRNWQSSHQKLNKREFMHTRIRCYRVMTCNSITGRSNQSFCRTFYSSIRKYNGIAVWSIPLIVHRTKKYLQFC